MTKVAAIVSASLIALATASFGAAGATAAPVQRIAVTVETGKPGATIDRHIFGQFAEHLAPASMTASGSAAIRS